MYSVTVWNLPINHQNASTFSNVTQLTVDSLANHICLRNLQGTNVIDSVSCNNHDIEILRIISVDATVIMSPFKEQLSDRS
jgi:hypothetical protein